MTAKHAPAKGEGPAVFELLSLLGGLQRVDSQHSGNGLRTAGTGKGFGCPAVVTYPRVLRAGARKPPRKEFCRLWGLAGRGLRRGWLTGLVVGGSTIAVGSILPRRLSTRRFQHDRRRITCLRRRRATAMRCRQRSGCPTGPS